MKKERDWKQREHADRALPRVCRHIRVHGRAHYREGKPDSVLYPPSPPKKKNSSASEQDVHHET